MDFLCLFDIRDCGWMCCQQKTETAMNILMRKTKKFINAEQGVTSLEYALLGSLIAVVIAASVTNLGVAVLGLFEMVAEQFANL